MSTAGATVAARLVSPSEEATRRIGALLGGLVEPGDVVLLSGELGAGKTTLVQGLVAALGASTRATSPTFALCHLYDSDPVVAHVDCWRLDQLAEVADLALEEVLDDGGVAVVEWGEAAAPLLGDAALIVTLSVPPGAPGPGGGGPGGERLVELADPGGGWRARIARLAELWADELAAPRGRPEAGRAEGP
ncbi:MAG TPA: tRNA (adenosine(37)-N6)-threonylcarbamoyltransferase complex ATPase subunit type 1 TsaE [Acidimicrobiales bacterium]|nr:tRNA (adenosine(37)-N6)-threonylcarbamoyltransferase complex ATPase subunit type 1 TsaE [Acidimicrobiales bacterium]